MKEEPEKPENHERWIISYADFTTLLLATFVVMYAVSSINASKFQEMAEAFSTAFIGRTVTIDGSGFAAGEKSPFNFMPSPVHVPIVTREKEIKNLPPALTQEDREPPPKPLPEDVQVPPPAAEGDKPATDKPASDKATVDSKAAATAAYHDEPIAPPDTPTENAAGRVRTLDHAYAELKQALANLIGKGQVRVSLQSLGVVIDINEVLLFKSGKAMLTPQALGLIDEIAGILRGLPYQIQVNGYTDDARIHNAQFDSNWDLSATRAISVVKRFAAAGVDPRLLVGAGFSEYHPIAPNTTPEGMAANRRVTIVVVSPIEGSRPTGRLFGDPQERGKPSDAGAAAAPPTAP